MHPKFCMAAFIAIAALISCAGTESENETNKPVSSEGTGYKVTAPAATDSVFIKGIESGNSYGKTTTSPVKNTNPQGNPVNAFPQPVNPQPATKDVVLSGINQTTVQTPPTTANTVAPGMNPAHGQPGHRCDINVGAPLNSKPNVNPATNVAATKPVQNPIVVNNNPPQPVQAVAPGMNPAHGQPGHRCDISVGASLNSAPKMATPPSVVSPIKIDSSKN